MRNRRFGLVTCVGFAAMLCVSAPARAQSLGAASSFAVQAAAGVTAAGGAGTVIAGDVGASPTPSITGFPPAVVTPPFSVHANDAAAIAAQAAVLALYSTLSAGACTSTPLPQLSGATFGPGIHCFSSTADLAANGNLTLTGAGVYIFRVPAALTANVGSTVTLAGVNPCNVFWQVGSAATANGVNFPGNVVAQSAVTLGVGAALTGRALATAGPVTLSGGNTIGGCSTPPPPPPACPTISLSPGTLPGGTAGVAYSQVISAIGGVAPYSFSIVSGSLPPGLTFTAAGVLAGTPTAAGSSTITVRGTDANGCFAERAYTIVIAAAPPPPPVCPTITIPGTLANGVVGIAYTQTLTATGGTGPYTFGTSALPAGLTLTPAGVLAGTPTTAASGTFLVRATDANGCFAERSFTIVIAAAPAPPPACPALSIAPATLPNATVGAPYNQTLSGSGGTGPYSFGVTSGTLPAGLTLTGAGVLAGTPTMAGTFVSTIRGTDANGCFQERTFTLTIPVAVPTLSEWALIALALVLGLVGYRALRMRAT